MIIKNSTVGFALALFDLSKEEKKLVKYKQDAYLLYEVFANQKDLLNFLNIKNLEPKLLEKIINEACYKIEKNIINFLIIVTLRKQAHLIPKVFKKLISLINAQLNIVEGFVYSLHKLSQIEINQIEHKVAQINKMQTKPELINKIDYQLICGIKIEIKDQVIEDSMDSRLTQLRNELLGRSL